MTDFRSITVFLVQNEGVWGKSCIQKALKSHEATLSGLTTSLTMEKLGDLDREPPHIPMYGMSVSRTPMVLIQNHRYNRI
jgi:hypothetical protein